MPFPYEQISLRNEKRSVPTFRLPAQMKKAIRKTKSSFSDTDSLVSTSRTRTLSTSTNTVPRRATTITHRRCNLCLARRESAGTSYTINSQESKGVYTVRRPSSTRTSSTFNGDIFGCCLPTLGNHLNGFGRKHT